MFRPGEAANVSGFNQEIVLPEWAKVGHESRVVFPERRRWQAKSFSLKRPSI
jgi:hypothetical protein